ncbi:MAG TPA: alpha/beta hydrolase [Solirubrobacterales bacterium]|nr:alpha/beta hydrolase [Solirubrobacterales bacterium]
MVEARGLRFHVAEAGAGDPVVMLHGWPQHWFEWRGLIPSLARRHRVLCPDLRGLGWSDAPAAGYEKEELASDVLALLDALELERVQLVGHDWGGWIGFLICMREPERIARLLALNILPPFLPPDARNLASLWRFWYQWVIASPLGEAAVRAAGAANPVFRWIGAGPPAWTPADRETFLGQFREPARARASVQYYRSFALREMPAILRGRYRRARLRTPTRLVFGTDDPVMSSRGLEDSERLADDLRVELVPGVGHFIADERPDLVLDRAMSFLGSRR